MLFVGNHLAAMGTVVKPRNTGGVAFANTAAAHVPSDDPGAAGLGGASPHPVLHANTGLGTTVTDGTLTITAPTNTLDGTYNGTITFSIIGS
jgi:hypothetical protein